MHNAPTLWGGEKISGPQPTAERSAVLELGSETGQTDGQADNGHHCIIPNPMGRGHNKINF